MTDYPLSIDPVRVNGRRFSPFENDTHRGGAVFDEAGVGGWSAGGLEAMNDEIIDLHLAATE